MITQAFILGAGLGTRLRPLTDDLPKPLVPVFHKPLITFALDHLIGAGVQSFVINTHRQPELFAAFFGGATYAQHHVELVHEPELLETGGGIKNAEPLLRSDPFITYSGDILTDVDLRPLLDEHFRQRNDVTLALRETRFGAGVALRDGRVVDIARQRGVEGNYDFANIVVWSSAIFRRIPPATKISFIPILTQWIEDNGKIGGIVLSDGQWFNIGSPREYLDVHRIIATKRWKPPYIREAEWPLAIAKDAQVDSTAEIRGCSAIGESSRVGAGAKLTDTIVWAGAQIASGSELRNCVVRSHQVAEGILQDVIV